VQCTFDNISVYTARWVYCEDGKKLAEFRAKAYDNLALDHSGALVYLAPTRVNLQLTLERLTGKRVEAKFSLDPTLLGGAVVRLGDTIYDGSLRNRLNELRSRLSAG